jgi:hypothetical protein
MERRDIGYLGSSQLASGLIKTAHTATRPVPKSSLAKLWVAVGHSGSVHVRRRISRHDAASDQADRCRGPHLHRCADHTGRHREPGICVWSRRRMKPVWPSMPRQIVDPFKGSKDLGIASKSSSPEATPKKWRLFSSLIARLIRFAKRESWSFGGCSLALLSWSDRLTFERRSSASDRVSLPDLLSLFSRLSPPNRGVRKKPSPG